MTRIEPGGNWIDWKGYKKDYALYGTELYTVILTDSGQNIFIGVECPLGAIPNSHTLRQIKAHPSQKDMETLHYDGSKNSRQTGHLILNLDDGYTMSGGPINYSDKDGVGFKYIYENSK